MAKKEKKTLKDKPFVPLPEVSEEEAAIADAPEQNLNQLKIALVQSHFAPIVIELVKDVLKQVPLVGSDQWETTKNAIIIDTSNDVLRDLVDHMEGIKRGKLAGKR